MRWLCWILPHAWRTAIDPEFQACDRCPKIRRTPPPPRRLPAGASACPHPGCMGWTAPPPKASRLHWHHEACPECDKGVRWERRDTIYEWSGPTATSDEMAEKFLSK